METNKNNAQGTIAQLETTLNFLNSIFYDTDNLTVEQVLRIRDCMKKSIEDNICDFAPLFKI